MILEENSLKQHLKPAFSLEQKNFFLNMYLHSPNLARIRFLRKFAFAVIFLTVNWQKFWSA